jgi:hypothetical protein
MPLEEALTTPGVLRIRDALSTYTAVLVETDDDEAVARSQLMERMEEVVQDFWLAALVVFVGVREGV